MTRPRFVYYLIVLILLAACGGAVPDNVEMSREVATAEPQQASNVAYAVKVIKNGDELALYQQADTGSVGGMLDGDQLQLFLSSPDNQDMLTVNIQGTERVSTRSARSMRRLSRAKPSLTSSMPSRRH